MGKVGSGSGRDVNVGEEKGSDGDDDEEKDDDDGKEEAGSGKGGILFASQGSKAQNCIELVAPNIQRISSFRKFIFSQTVR